MEIKELLASGLVELYCIGMVTDEEKAIVEKLAAESREVRDEIAAVNETLKTLAMASGKAPSPGLKDKIMEIISRSTNDKPAIQFPPRLSQKSTVEEWMKYIADNNIAPPVGYDPYYWLDLPGDEKQTTYIVWAKKGVAMEEAHEDEDEYLFMLSGHCSITIDGRIGYYNKGDVVYIPKKSVHRAEALSEEPMLIVGQRIAA